jgi:hypothetical protein
MSKFSASDAAFAGFQLVRENLKTVAIWCALMMVVSMASEVLSIKFYGPQLEAFQAFIVDNSNPDPDELAKVMAGVAPLFLWLLPYSLLVNGIIFAALNRLVQRHDASRTAFLGLGKTELRQVAVWLLLNLTIMGVLCAGALVGGILGGLGGAAGALLAFLALLASICGAIYLAVRLSLASAVTFDTGKVTLFRTLPLTKGLFWQLLGTYFLAVVMSVIVILLLWIIVSAVALIVTGDFSGAGQMLHAENGTLEAYFTPLGIVQAFFGAVVSVVWATIIFTPAPTIYQILKNGGATLAVVDASV